MANEWSTYLDVYDLAQCRYQLSLHRRLGRRQEKKVKTRSTDGSQRDGSETN